MIEINLLPWREHLRRRQMQNKIILYGLFVLLLLVGTGCYWYGSQRSVRALEPVRLPVVDQWQSNLQQIRFIGFVRQEKRIWALLSLSDGKVADVQVGSFVMGGARVMTINEKQVVFALPHQQFFTASFAGA
jgi:hypothetical protein